MPYKDPEQRRAYGRAWMRRNLDRARDAMQRWRARHPERREKKRADDHAYYARHSERLKARTLSYARLHPEVRRSADQRRRARFVRAEGRFSAAQWKALVEEYGGRCAYCLVGGPLHADHRIPLCRGGSNWIENILPACARCNTRKHTMTEEEFRERLRREAGGAPSERIGTQRPRSRSRPSPPRR